MDTQMDQVREQLQTDLTYWNIGPYHGALPGPMRLRLKLDGEILVSGEVETGYLHRGLEKSLELHNWHSAIAYVDHLDPEGAVFGEMALCLAVEEIAGTKVPLRAQVIRLILAELTRVSTHLAFVARIARAVGSETMIHYVLRDREKVLDLFELLTGARFSLNFLRYGGVSADVTEGFIERVLEVCDLIRIRLKEYNDLFSFNHAFMRRTSFVGVLHADLVRELGVTGPNARASGVAFDVRKNMSYAGYDALDFEVPIGLGDGGTVGDVHDRFLVRIREIAQSLEMLRQLTDLIPEGEFAGARVDRDFKVPRGEAYIRIESPRGMLGCHVASDGSEKPARVQFRTPTLYHLQVIPKLLSGVRIDDLPVILASLDLGVAEADR